MTKTLTLHRCPWKKGGNEHVLNVCVGSWPRAGDGDSDWTLLLAGKQHMLDLVIYKTGKLSRTSRTQNYRISNSGKLNIVSLAPKFFR